uniref:LIM and calponin homology domains 1 n=1 Tax=Callorhinchus milii TaxID=7868 RepID=A0A4W3ICU7_CALMI
MSLRRASYHEPKANLPFNQYLPNKSNQTAYMPAPLRKKRAERGDHYRKSWSNATSPVGGERPFSHPEPIEEECSDEEFAETLPALSSVRGVEDTEATEKLKVSGGENSGACGKQLLVCVAECSEHEAPKGDTKGEEKDDEEAKLKRMQKAGITVMPASKRYTSPNPFEENSGQTTPDIILRRENAFLTNTQSVDLESEEEGEEEEQKMPDLEKDDLALRRTQLSQFKPKVVTNQFLPGPCTKKDKERWENIKKSSQKAASNSQARHRKRPSPNHIQATESKAVAPQKEKTFLKSQRRSESEEEEPAKAKVPDVQRDDLARRKTLGGLTSRHEPQTFIPTTVTQADMEIWERLKVSTDTSSKPEETFTEMCTAEYFRNPPSPVLTVQTVNLNESIYSSSEGEEDEGKIPDLEKDDMMTRRIGATCKAKGPAFQQFLPVPSSQKGESKNEPLKEYEKDTKNVRSSKDEAPWTSVSMNDMRPEDDTLVEPHSKARHEEIRNIHNRLREEQDKWQDDLARWKSRRRSASQDLIKRKEEREFVEKIMSGEQNLSDRRKSIKTYKEIVEEKERRENELQEEYKKARNPEEAQAILKRYSQRFIISEAVLESLQLPKCLERSQSVDSDSSSSPTKDTNVLKYLRQQSLPAQKYTATVEAMIIPPSQSQLNFSTGLTSPTRTVASKAVPMLTPKPYSQPKDSQTVLKSFKVDGKIKMNGETSPTFTRVEGKECTSVVSALSLTKSQMFEGVTQVDCHPLISQTDDGKLAARPELVNCLSVNNKENKATEKEGTETSVSIAITQKISTEEKSDSNLSCNEIERQIAVDAAQEDCKEDHRCYSETSTPHDVFSSNLDPKNAIVTEGVTDKSVSLNHEGEEPRESAQKWHVQEMYEPGILQQDKAGDALDSAQRIKNPDSELDDKNHQPADVAELQAEMEAKENLNIPVAPLNIPKCFERWSWDPEEERKRQERWQKEQERLLQERYRREQEKLRQEWEKAQKEVEEEERRYHEEELKIIQETVAPITSRSTGFSNQIPTEWISPPITEENRNPAPIEETAADRKHKQLALQNQKQMVEAENWQPKEECQRLAEEERNRQAAQEKGGQAGEQQRLTSEQVEKLSSKKDENVQKDHWDDTAKNKSENSNWQEVNQLTNEEQRLNLQTVAHTNQMETEVVSERLKHADWQTSTTVHQQPTAQAAGSPVNSDRIWNTQELPPSLELQRMKSHGVQDEQKTMSLDRSWTHQSNTGNTKRSGSHENLQSGQSVPLPHSTSSLQLQSPSRSVSGKKLCSTCRLPLGKGAAMIIETLSLYFHIQCFKCGICQGQLGDATTGTDVRIRNGLLNCHECYIRSRIAGQPTTL